MTQYPEAYLCRELGMAVVNIALITDYDAGVLEGTHAVTAHDVLAVFEQNAERIRKVVLDMVGRFPADLDALGARDALAHTRGDGHVAGARRHPDLRDGAVAADRMTSMPTTPTPAAAPAPAEPMHGCVRCGARIPISESMCEQCNPLGLKAAVGVAGARDGHPGCRDRRRPARRRRAARDQRRRAVHVVAWSGSAADPAGLRVTITITNTGSSAGSTTCRISDPSCRGIGPEAAFVDEPDHPARRDRDVRPGRDQPRDDAAAAHRGLPVRGTRPPVRRRPRVRPRDRRAGGTDPVRALRAGRAHRRQGGAGRRDRGRPPVRGARDRRDPGAIPDGRDPRRGVRSAPHDDAGTRREGSRSGGPGSSTRSTGPSTTPTASRSSASSIGARRRWPARGGCHP